MLQPTDKSPSNEKLEKRLQLHNHPARVCTCITPTAPGMHTRASPHLVTRVGGEIDKFKNKIINQVENDGGFFNTVNMIVTSLQSD